jgi:hypothetical protein
VETQPSLNVNLYKYSKDFVRDGTVRLVPARAWRGVALALEAEQDLPEAGEVGGARPGARERLALAVLELDERRDPRPRRALPERVGERRDVVRFLLPATASAHAAGHRRRGGPHLFSRMVRSLRPLYSS